MGYEYDLLHGDIDRIGRTIRKNHRDACSVKDTLTHIAERLASFQLWRRKVDDRLESHTWLFQAIREDNMRRDRIIYMVSAVGVIASFIFPLVL